MSEKEFIDGVAKNVTEKLRKKLEKQAKINKEFNTNRKVERKRDLDCYHELLDGMERDIDELQVKLEMLRETVWQAIMKGETMGDKWGYFRQPGGKDGATLRVPPRDEKPDKVD